MTRRPQSHRRAVRRSPRRALALLVVVAMSAGLTLFGVENAHADITDPFTIAYQTNEHGSIVLRGNASLTCSGAGCASALDGTASGTALNNNTYVMTNVDVDSNPATFNSSTATLALPTGSTVLFAGLYWGADTTAGTSGAVAPNAAGRNQVLLSAAGGAYATVNSTQLSTPVSGSGAYQGFAEVTSQVLAGGNGTYAVANIQAGTGQDRYAGWALVIAYRNPSERNRNMVIYDGFGFVRNQAGQTSLDIPVSGFQTPQGGAVTTKIGTVVYEGDRGYTGDSLKLNNVALSDTPNPVDNVFNSTVTDSGASLTARNPASSNLLGVDIDQFDASNKLGNNVTSATLSLATTTETFYPGVVTFTTDLYGPLLNTTLTGTDVDGGNLLPGDEIEYTFTVRNDGTDASILTVLTDAVPTKTTYVPGSLKIGGSPVTDPDGDDTGAMVADSGTFRLGTGATSAAGGELAFNATTTVSYRVKVDMDVTAGYSVLNTGNLSYSGKNSGSAYAHATAASAVTVLQPTADRSVTVAVAPGTVQRGGPDDPVTYDLTVVDHGPELEPDASVTLTLPAGVTAGALPAGCSAAGQTVTCDLDTVASGGTVHRLIPATVGATAAFSSTASAHVTGLGNDPDASNDTGTVAVVVNTAPDAHDDPAATTNGVPILVDVLGNDTDPDTGDTLHTTAVSTPAHGSTAIQPDGSIRYTPVPGYGGSDPFTYTVTDDNGGSVTRTVAMTVANAAPTATDDTAATATGVDATLLVLGNDTDPNGDTLSITADTDGAHGTVDHTGTDVTYRPAPGFAGVDTFTYTVSDGHGGTDVATVTVTVDGPPAASDDVAATGYDTTTPALSVLVNDADPNGDPLTVTAVTQGGHGAVTFTGSGVTYDPDPGFSGADTFTYTVSDGHGGTDVATVTVTVADAPPVAAPHTAGTTHHQAVTVPVLTGATDPNPGDTLTVAGLGNPGDGTVVDNHDGTVTYTPNAGFAGTDTFSFTISDGHGGTDTATVTVTVANAAPHAVGDTQGVEVDHPQTVTVLANDTDANGDALTVDIVGPPAHGSAVANPDGTVTYTPDPGYTGTDGFTYRVTDPDGATDTATVSLTVTNLPPTAHPDAGTTPPDTAITLPVTANDTDPGNDPLTVDVFTDGGHGTVTVNGAHTALTYTPTAGFAGSDTFTYTVTDGHGGYSSATVTVTVLNAAPVAHDDVRRVESDTPAVLPVLTNDTDANGHQLSVQAIGQPPAHGSAVINANGTVTYTPAPGYRGPDSFTYTATDGNPGGVSNTATVTLTVDGAPVAVADTAATDTGAPVTITVLGNDTDPEGGAVTVTGHTDPAHGLLLPHADGTFTYTPDAGWSGVDTFTYRVQDPSGGTSADATVTITVRNADPVATADAVSTGRGAVRTVDVLGNDTDANTGQTLTIASVTQPGHGSTAIVAGQVRYTPAAGFTGTDTFTYTVSDGNGGTAIGTVTVTVSSAAPQAAADSGTTGAGTPVTVPVLDNDDDPDGDDLTVVSVTQPAHGTVQIGAAHRDVVYTPPAGFTGTVTFQYVVEDPGGLRDTATVTVHVTGAAPVVVDDDPGVPVNTVTDIDVLANDGAGDPDAALTLESVTQPGHGSTRIVGGKVRYTPAAGFKGTDTFTYTVSDGNGGTATGTVTVTVSNSAPVASADARTTPYGTKVTVGVLGNDMDPNGDGLTITGVTPPAHGTVQVTAAKQAVVYTPPADFSGVVTFTYTISDGDGGTATAEVTITVGAPPAVPDRSAHALPGSPVRITLPTHDEHDRTVTVVGLGAPKHGTATLNADGTVTYTPDPGFTGTDTFSYTVTDADGGLASGTVTVTVGAAGGAPVADDDTAATVVDTPVVVNVLDGDTDPDGDRLTVTGATRPRHGTVRIADDGTVTYTPDAGFSGTDTFTYSVTDGNGHSVTATVTVTVAPATGTSLVSLPRTGAAVLSVAGLGVVVVVAGAALVGYGSRGGNPLAAVLPGRTGDRPAPLHRRTHRRRR